MSWNIIKLREESLSSSNVLKILVGLGVFICKLWTYKQLFWWYDVMSYLMDLSSKEKYTLLIDILNVLRITRFMKLTCIMTELTNWKFVEFKTFKPRILVSSFQKGYVSFYSVLVFLGCNMFFCPPNQTVQLLILKCVYFVLFLKASIKCFTSKYVIINQSFDQNRPFTSYQAYIWTTMELILSVWRICYKPTGLFENIFTT